MPAARAVSRTVGVGSGGGGILPRDFGFGKVRPDAACQRRRLFLASLPGALPLVRNRRFCCCATCLSCLLLTCLRVALHPTTTANPTVRSVGMALTLLIPRLRQPSPPLLAAAAVGHRRRVHRIDDIRRGHRFDDVGCRH